MYNYHSKNASIKYHHLKPRKQNFREYAIYERLADNYKMHFTFH